ncbi:SymE family type I addiction module toxin [Snodgrassella communis]
MKGGWLEQLGFYVGCWVNIKTEQSKLVGNNIPFIVGN